jgi:MFS family permease
VRSLFQLRDFRLLWIGQATSYFGDGLTNLTLLILTQRLTGSVSAVAATSVAIALPQVLFGLMAGVYVDRWDRRKVMILSDLGRGLVVLGFLFVHNAGDMWLLYVLAFAQAAVGTFFTPAKMAFVPAIVGSERLLAANSLGETTRAVAMMLGTTVAGVIAGAGDALWICFLLDAVTFIGSAVCEMLISTDGKPATTSNSRAWADLLTGLRVARSSRMVIGVMMAAAVAMLGLGAVNVLLVPFVVGELRFSEAWFGPIEGAQVAGLVLAGSLAAVSARWLRAHILVAAGLAGLGAAVAALSVVTSPWHMLVTMFVVGWFLAPVQASVTTLLQSEVLDEHLGKIGSMFSTVVTSTNVASMALAGVIAGVLGSRGVFVASGTVAVLAGAVSAFLLRPRLAHRPVSPTVAGAAAE